MNKDRGAYYDQWDKKTREMVDEVDKENDAAEAAAYTAPRGPPTAQAASSMQAQKRISKERAAVFGDQLSGVAGKKKIFENITGECKPQVEEIANKVVSIESSDGFRFRLPEYGAIADMLGSDLNDGDKVQKLAKATPIKLDIAGCKNGTVEVSSALITRTVEVHKCSDVILEIDEDMMGVKAVETIQIDDSSNICVIIKSAAKSLPMIYHAHVEGLTVKLVHGGAGEKEILVEAPAETEEDKKNFDENEIKQYVTYFCEKKGAVNTKRVVRDRREFVVDPRNEEEEKKAKAEKAGLADVLFKVDDLKKQGNDAFRQGDVAQALAYYQQVIMAIAKLDLEKEEDVSVAAKEELKEIHAAILSNSSQCQLKLGRLPEALSLAQECVEVNPKNTKGWFRIGMAYHAQGNFKDAVPALSKAEQLDPKNEQIKTALKMAGFKYQQMMAKGAGKGR